MTTRTFDNIADLAAFIATVAKNEALARWTEGKGPLFIDGRWFDEMMIRKGVTVANMGIYLDGLNATALLVCPHRVRIESMRHLDIEDVRECATCGHICARAYDDEGVYTCFAEARDAVLYALKHGHEYTG